MLAALVLAAAAWYLYRSGALSSMAGVGAILFGVYVDASFNVYSSLTSSPWTFENFSKDKDRAASCRRYVMMANAAALALGLFGTIVAHTLWPLAGSVVVVVGMYAVYHKAIAKGEKAGAAGDKPDDQWNRAGVGLTLVPAAG